MGTQGRLQDKVAVITGAASGIGAGTVRRFIVEGAKVIIADIQDEPGLALAQELGANTRYIHTDVTNEDQVAAAVDLAVKEFGRIDIMFNNAGVVGAVGRISETNTDQWNRTVAILLNSVYFGMKHASRHMCRKEVVSLFQHQVPLEFSVASGRTVTRPASMLSSESLNQSHPNSLAMASASTQFLLAIPQLQ